MTTLQRLFYALFIAWVLGVSNFSTFAQAQAPLPAELNQNSSVSEILTWLDRTTFRNARVVLKDTLDASTYIPPWAEYEPAKHTFMVTEGFRVTNIDGCSVALRNDDAKIVAESMNIGDLKTRLVADLSLLLERLSPSKGKSTYRYTKDPEKVRLLGAWRTEYEYKGHFSRNIVALHLYSGNLKDPARWEGKNLAFTFDTKEMSEEFDAAFRQAIRLCRSK